MLERILEPEVMDSEQDAQEYEAIDNSAVNDEFVARALELAPPTGKVLDAGTGPGDIAVLLAQRAKGLRVVAIDLGEHMLALARKNVARAGLSDRIEIARGDVKSTGQSRGAFDMIISNSLVHHIPEPTSFLAEMKRVARPGAGLFIKDLHRPDTEAELRHLVRTYAADCTPYQQRIFGDSLHAALTVAEVQRICERLELVDVEVRRCSDRHWSIERRASSPA
jgi:ubiquinone/menaquinone biosynthesis C-methylase UbiE